MPTTTHQTWPISFIGDEAAYDPGHVATATTFAQQVLWAKTGRRFGLALTTGEQYRAPSTTSTSDGCVGPWLDDAHDWTNASRSRAGCVLILEHQPVRDVREVRVDGAVLAPSSYALEGALLRRVDGNPWPSTDPCDAARIEVDYRWGAGYPEGADAAMGELAFEVLEALAGRNCRLPSTILTAARMSVQRQGVNIDHEVPAGSVGLPLCDALIDTVNPHRLVTRSRVFSPDMGMRV